MDQKEQPPLSFFQVVKSVLRSFAGVQNNKTRERDFTRGRPRDFILVGLIFTVLFILAVWGVVSMVMSLAL